MKLKNAAQKTAYCGLSTRVETMVAMEFAASCRPFRKSKNSATPIRPTRSGKGEGQIHPLNVLDHDAADLVGDVLEAVDHLLQLAIEFAAELIQRHGVGPAMRWNSRLRPGVVQSVGALLDLGDLFRPARRGRVDVGADLFE